MIKEGLTTGSRCLLVLLACALLLAGCGTWYAGLREAPEDTSQAYASALARHSMRGWRSKGFDRLVSVTATIQTPTFVSAMRAEQSRLLSLPAGSVSDARWETLDVESGTGVVLFVEALQPAWQRLDRAESVWRFFLEVDGQRHEPSNIEALDRRDATLVHLFPYVTGFGRAWLLTFPVDRPGRQPVLVMTGAPAQLELEFELP